MHAVPALLVPQVDKGRTPELAAKRGAQARAGNTERMPGAVVVGEDERVGERPPDRTRLDLGAFGCRPRPALGIPIVIELPSRGVFHDRLCPVRRLLGRFLTTSWPPLS